MKRQGEILGATFGAAAHDGRRAWRQLLVTDVVYKLLSVLVLAPLLGLSIRAGLALSGSPVVADVDILLFVLTPLGIVLLLLVSALALTIVALEQACLMTIAAGSTQHVLVAVPRAFGYVAGRAWKVLAVALGIVARSLVLAAPVGAGLALVHRLLLGAHDINHYLANRPPEFLLAVALAALLLLVLAGLLIPRLIGWCLALPLVLFEDVSAGEALAASHRRVSGQRHAFAAVMVLWGAGALALIVTVSAVLFALGRKTVPLAGDDPDTLLVSMVLVGAVWVLANALVSWVNGTSFALLLVRLYRELGSGRSSIVHRVEDGRDALQARSRVRAPALVLLLLAALALFACGLAWFHLGRVRGHEDIVVIAHRGASALGPENTIAAVEAALQEGTDYVEIDVQESVDGDVVVIHDSDLMRVAGEELKIWEASAEELRAIDIGSWFGPAFSDQRVPLLGDVLEAARDSAGVVIELKYYGHDQRLEERVAGLVEDAGMEDSVLVMSLDRTGLERMQRIRPDWPAGLLTATAVGDLTESDVDFLAVSSSLATRRLARQAHARGMRLFAWTVNDPVQMFRLANRGVDGLITDRPGLAREVLDRRAELAPVGRLMVALAFLFGVSASDVAARLDAADSEGPARGAEVGVVPPETAR